MKNKRVTLKQIADETGVSVAAVSAVLNDKVGQYLRVIRAIDANSIGGTTRDDITLNSVGSCRVLHNDRCITVTYATATCRIQAYVITLY